MNWHYILEFNIWEGTSDKLTIELVEPTDKQQGTVSLLPANQQVYQRKVPVGTNVVECLAFAEQFANEMCS